MISVVVIEQSDPRLSPFYVEVRDVAGARLLGKGCITLEEANTLKLWSEALARHVRLDARVSGPAPEEVRRRR